MNPVQLFKKYRETHPLALIVVAAAFFRLLAVLFSKGYGMHDDHFLVIEAAQSWVDGQDYNSWLPENSKTGRPSGHSMLYPGLHYLLFSFLENINITGPQAKMYIVRFLHAAYSLFIPILGYKIAANYSGKKTAFTVGIMLAVFWIFPFLSVRNLTEVVCIPPLLGITLLFIKNFKEKRGNYLALIGAGLLGGLAISLRFQTVLFIGGFGLILLINKCLLQSLVFGLICFTGLFLTQITDLFTWGYPFAEIEEYIRYNLENSTTYFEREWYLYIIFVAGVLIPPVSLFMISGFLYRWKKHLLLFLPAFLFFVFHSYFPNKQERFIIPAIPFIIILGLVGWNDLKHRFFQHKYKGFFKYSWVFFWGLNFILLLPISVSSSKKSRVDSMVYLSQQSDFNNFIMECSHRGGYMMPPLYYIDAYPAYFYSTSSIPISEIPFHQDWRLPNYILFIEENNLEKRIEKTREVFPDLKKDTVIQPSVLDQFLHALNPHNRNEVIHIYKSGDGPVVNRSKK